MTNSASTSPAPRSCLCVPGSSAKMLAKAVTLPADQLVIDLEDAVAPSAKIEARQQVAHLIATGAFASGASAGRALAVRVNATGSPWIEDDIVFLVKAASAAPAAPSAPALRLILPKAESAQDLRAFDARITEAEAGFGIQRGTIGIEALIESARGLIAASEIAMASRRLSGLIFGPADFAASIGLQVPVAGDQPVGWEGGDVYYYPLMQILLAARAAGVNAINGPYLGIGDLDGCRRFAQRSALLGYDGMWALHPDQLAVINEVFTPSPEVIAKAQALIEAYDQATTTQAQGAINLDGEMVDEASRQQALGVLAKARLQGTGGPTQG